MGVYCSDRAADLADVLTVELTTGSGGDIHVQCTGYLGAVAGWSSQKGIVMRGRYLGVGARESSGILLLGATATANGSDVGEPGPSGTYRIWGLLLPVSYQVVPALHVGYAPSWPHMADVELGASALVGFHLGLSPGEGLDFMFGLVGLDPAGDDEPVEGRPGRSEEDLPPLMILPPEGWDRWFP